MKNIIRTIILESLLFEDEQHVRKLFTNWANKKSGNPELALSLMDDFLKYQKKIKRDFSSFSSAEEMKQAIDQARASEVEKVKASDVNKIFENSDVLVVAANTKLLVVMPPEPNGAQLLPILMNIGNATIEQAPNLFGFLKK